MDCGGKGFEHNVHLAVFEKWPNAHAEGFQARPRCEGVEKMSVRTESPLVTCLNCKKRLPASDAAYLIGENGSGLGMCKKCVRADTEDGENTDEEED